MKARWILVFGYCDTRGNKEDFALTPYLASVYIKGSAYGLSVTFGWWSFAIFFGKRHGNYFQYINFSK